MIITVVHKKYNVFYEKSSANWDDRNRTMMRMKKWGLALRGNGGSKWVKGKKLVGIGGKWQEMGVGEKGVELG